MKILLLGYLVICNDTILSSLINDINKRKGKNTAANSLDDKGIREQYRSELSRIKYLFNLKKPSSVCLCRREGKKYILQFLITICPQFHNFIGLSPLSHYRDCGYESNFFLIYFPSVIRGKHKFCHFNHIFLFLKWSFTLILFYEHTSIFLHSISSSRPPLHLH